MVVTTIEGELNVPIPRNFLNLWNKLTKRRTGHVKVFLSYFFLYLVGLFIFYGSLIYNVFFQQNFSLAIALAGFQCISNYMMEEHYVKTRNEDILYEFVDRENREYPFCSEWTERLYRNISELWKKAHPILKTLCKILRLTFLGIELKWLWENFVSYFNHVQEVRDGRTLDSANITLKEVNAFIQAKRQLSVKATYSLISNFWKALTLSIIYFSFMRTFEWPNSFCCFILLKFCGILMTIISCGYSVCNYNTELFELGKILDFKERVYHRAESFLANPEKETIPGTLFNVFEGFKNVVEIGFLFAVLGCAWKNVPNWYDMLFLSVIFIGLLFLWNLALPKICPKMRLNFENPPYGVSPQMMSFNNFLHKYISVFCFHGIRRTAWNVIIHNCMVTLVSVATIFSMEMLVTNYYGIGNSICTSESCHLWQNANATMTEVIPKDLSFFDHCMIFFGVNYLISDENTATFSSLVANKNKTFCKASIHSDRVITYAPGTPIFVSYWFLLYYWIFLQVLNILWVGWSKRYSEKYNGAPILLENAILNWRIFFCQFVGYDRSRRNNEEVVKWCDCKINAFIEAVNVVENHESLWQTCRNFFARFAAIDTVAAANNTQENPVEMQEFNNPLSLFYQEFEFLQKKTENINLKRQLDALLNNFDEKLELMSSHRLSLVRERLTDIVYVVCSKCSNIAQTNSDSVENFYNL